MDTQKLMNITLPLAVAARDYKAPVRGLAAITNIALNVITLGMPIWINWAHAIHADGGFKQAFLPLYLAAKEEGFPIRAAALITNIALDALVIPVIVTVLMSAAYALRKEESEETSESEGSARLAVLKDSEVALRVNQFRYEGMTLGRYIVI